MLEINNVSKHYKDFSLKNINISLDRGFVMGFIGPNGAGKSTTIRLIMNLIKKDSGEIKIFGFDHIKDELQIKEKIGFVYDENNFYEELTVKEMKNIIRPFYKNWDENAFLTYVKKFGLPLNKQIKQLSKGMKMKFSLAIALSHHAELLIMDEPTSGLDPLIRSELLHILRSLMEDENKAIFFSTHITSDLEKIADYITIINNGEIILSKPMDELLEQYAIVKGNKEFLETATNLSFIGVEQNKFGFKGLYNDKKELLDRFGNQVMIEKPTLEDILLFSTKGSGQNVSSY
ncbi:ABC transporter ATP-binding protein [Caldifermentibacillus hisashii]|uniref:ABC transporter ATP-binding protein n=1 Tax=Caldifermentibacillus hisashii TaxID=996558 RepID=UPI0034D3A94A